MPKMKDSGVEWIGEIPESWVISKLKYSSAFINGFAFDSNQFSIDGKYPVIRIGDFQSNQINYDIANKIDDNSNLENFQILKNDILIAMSGATIGKIAYVSKVDSPSYINQRVGITRNDNPNFSSKYVYYSLLSPEFIKYIYYTSFGSAQPNVSGDTIMDYYITFSSLEQQEKTVIFLDLKTSRIKSLIDNLNNQIDKLKEYKKALITKCVTKGLDPNVPLKDSCIEWIGEISEKWLLIKIKDTSWLKGRIGWQGLKSTEFITEGPYLITGTDFADGYINWDSCVHISKERFEEAPEIHIKEDDLLITKDGTIGKVAIAKNCPHEVSLNSGVLLIRNVGNFKYFDKFLYYVLLSNEFLVWYENSQTGNSTIRHLYQEQFYNFQFAYPPIAEQEEIASYLDKKCSEINALISSKQQQIDKLNEYQKSLIYEYVTGKKEVI